MYRLRLGSSHNSGVTSPKYKTHFDEPARGQRAGLYRPGARAWCIDGGSTSASHERLTRRPPVHLTDAGRQGRRGRGLSGGFVDERPHGVEVGPQPAMDEWGTNAWIITNVRQCQLTQSVLGEQRSSGARDRPRCSGGWRPSGGVTQRAICELRRARSCRFCEDATLPYCRRFEREVQASRVRWADQIGSSVAGRPLSCDRRPTVDLAPASAALSLDEFGARSVDDRRPSRRVEPGDEEVDRRDQEGEPQPERDDRVGTPVVAEDGQAHEVHDGKERGEDRGDLESSPPEVRAVVGVE